MGAVRKRSKRDERPALDHGGGHPPTRMKTAERMTEEKTPDPGTHSAWFRSRSECSLKRRMSGKLARCPPGFIVKSRGWFVIYARQHVV